MVEVRESDSREWHWKINETLLKVREYEEKLSQELDSFFFFSTNETGEVTPFCLWETHKCVMRGVLISLGAHRKRMRNEQIESLLKRIQGLEVVHKKSQAQQTEEKLVGLREELNLLLIDKAKAKLTRCRWTFYEFGNKPSRMLANALRETSARNHIVSIERQGDEMVSSSQTIAQTTRVYNN